MSSPPVRMQAVPQADSAMVRGPVAVLLQMVLDQGMGRGPAERHAAGVGTARCRRSIEVAPGRQHLGPAAGGRTRRAGGDEAAVETGQECCRLAQAPLRRRRRPADRGREVVEHGPRLPPAEIGRPRPGHRAPGPACRAAPPCRPPSAMVPGIIELTARRQGSWAGPGRSELGVERIEAVQREVGGEGPGQGGLGGGTGPRGRRSERQEEVGAAMAVAGCGPRRAARRGSAAP